jgi:anti-sigma regulatory factor (Ser/Thr protein kinase)
MAAEVLFDSLLDASTGTRVRVPVAHDADVAIAGEQGRKLASRLDFSPTDLIVITAAIHEVARHVLSHGGSGDLMVHLIERRGRQGLAIVARDKGPGITDVREALRDASGLSLASARRLMDEFQVRSEPGRGTTITMRKWTKARERVRLARRPRERQ